MDLVAYGKSMESAPYDVIKDLQAAVLTWHAGLHSTGGALKPEKCSWSILAYKFKDGRPQIHTPKSFPMDIFLPLPSRVLKLLKRIPASVGIKAVGVIQAMNGKMKPPVNAIKKKADEWADHVKAGWMTRPMAWTCLRTMIWPSLAYPLKVCSMTTTQGDAIIVKLYQALLLELGLQRRFPKLWQHAPRTFQALALPHPYFVQGQEQVSIFQKMGLSQEISSGLIRITTDQAQLEIGRSTPLLQEDFDTWVFLLTPSLWDFCWEFQIMLEAHHLHAPEIQCDNDIFLMELLEQRFNFTGTVPEQQNQWRALNCCRLSLQVLFLSNIASGDGTRIRRDYFHYQGKRARLLSSKWQWPLQKPTKLDWDLWHDVMHQLSSLSTGNLDRRFHLGPWLREPHQDRPWRYDPDGGFLYQYKEDLNVWKRYWGQTPSMVVDPISPQTA
jgi:hypothetical protein